MTEFYAAAATLVGVFVLLNAALKNRAGLDYAALFAVMLALVWVFDAGGGALPLGLDDSLERAAAMAFALVGCALGFFTAERGIDPVRPIPWVRRGYRLLAAASLILAASVWFLPEEIMVPGVNTLLAVMLMSHVVPALTWRTLASAPFRLPALTAGGLFVVVAGLFFIFGLAPNGGAAIDGRIFRWLFALVALPAMAAIALAVLDLRRAREAALEAAATAARAEAETAAALLEAEQNYSRARSVAAAYMRRISTVTHDIRQPIAALRAELDALAPDIEGENADRFDCILSHFDALMGDLSGPGTEFAEADDAEDVPAALLFSMLDRLFRADAVAQGIDLRFVASEGVFHARAVVLMRIASNLISNAIRHSGASRILVGIRHRGGDGVGDGDGDRMLCLEILDNGNGFAGIGIDAARAAGVKGDGSDGAGLGLSIVDELADANGYRVARQSVDGRGSAFSITVPTARR